MSGRLCIVRTTDLSIEVVKVFKRKGRILSSWCECKISSSVSEAINAVGLQKGNLVSVYVKKTGKLIRIIIRWHELRVSS